MTPMDDHPSMQAPIEVQEPPSTDPFFGIDSLEDMSQGALRIAVSQTRAALVEARINYFLVTRVGGITDQTGKGVHPEQASKALTKIGQRLALFEALLRDGMGDPTGDDGKVLTIAERLPDGPAPGHDVG